MTNRAALEQIALAEYWAALGEVIEAGCILAYNDHDDSVEVHLDPPAKVRVDITDEDSILHWNDETWLDPYWDVTPVEDREELRGLRSFWIDGPSHELPREAK